MDTIWLAVGIMLVAGALPCMVFGYLIAVKQQRKWISGWNESNISNPAAYGRLVGFSLLLLGLAIAALALAWVLQLLTEEEMAVSLLLASLLPVVAAIVASIRYAKT